MKESQKSKVKSQKLNAKDSELRTPNSKLIFILGGARSGKSAYALKLAESIAGERLYLATAEALDKEMAERIKKHKKERGNNWTTIEEPMRIADVIAKDKKHAVILLDCLTLWLSNLITNYELRITNLDSQIAKQIASLISACKKTKANIIVVSNEVGLGIVPDNPLARRFRDIAGIANQKMAEAADEVYFVVSRIGMRIK
ncbi:MAG: bifunctional adenosylcobinamide kinase/adenosylcobinamide-phosphate guanylyltransferase [Deltaproteobacteria bacterium]|nr:bifunctional adenosylcobinamide kinase/adenosylcobinamide-phosphate guanylyltransferase [Deltaproteobacteria bacterium]